MIKLLRIDDRLIHGQVAVSWTSFLGADTILVANDKAITDKLMQMAFNMAKPPQAILSIKSLEGAVAVINNPKHESKNILVVAATPQDAWYLLERCPAIASVCVGGIRQAPGKKMIECQVYLDQGDVDALDKMHKAGKNVFLQPVPTGRKLGYSDIIREFQK